MRLFLATTFFLLTQNLFAYTQNAMNIQCSGTNRSFFILYIGETANTVRVASFFDGRTLWLPNSITVNGNDYSMHMFRPESIGAGTMPEENALESLNFTLPANRKVSRVQTGGYYIPEYTTYPAQFTIDLKVQTKNGDSLAPIHASCIGY